MGESLWDDLVTDFPRWITNGPPPEHPTYTDFVADMEGKNKKDIIWLFGISNV